MPKVPYTIQSLKAALDLLASFSRADGAPLRINDLCEQAGLSKNRTYRILSTLCEQGYLERGENPSEYRLGPALLVLGELYRKRYGLREHAAPILRELARASGDTATLMVRFDEKCLIVEGIQGEYSLQSRTGIGESWRLHAGAGSKFLLAAVPEPERAALLERTGLAALTSKTITGLPEQYKAVEKALVQGYAVEDEELELGLVGVGAPVRDYSGSIVAAVELAIPTVRFTPEHEREAIGLVVESARQLSRKLGFFE